MRLISLPIYIIAFALLSIAALMAGSAGLRASAQAYPEASYEASIPTLKAVVGHQTGEDISSIAELHAYFRALEQAAPDRISLKPYAQSWQDRELLYAVISSPENMARLDEIRADTARLAAGNLDDADISRISDRTPAVVWLSFGVHGDEISPPDSAAFLAYHLLAARGNALVDKVLANTIIILDPSQNPDGRDRFVQSFDATIGLQPTDDRHAAEHDQPWPGGRYNHYLFDLNRDWFALTQPETRGKVSAVLRWNPVVYVDSHEMGGDNTYYFPPPADPINPNIPREQQERLVEMGRNHARWFDQFGVPYFTREVYDAFYPGYGDTWPMLNGATAMTFEQASARGLSFQRRDGDVLTYSQGVRNNVLASLSTLEVVAGRKADYLAQFAAYRRDALEAGSNAEDRFHILDLNHRAFEAERLARRLALQGIRVQRASAGTRLCGETLAKGALIVDSAQPQARLIQALLRRDTALPPDFIEEQEGRRDRGLNHELYDVNAWSLPLMSGVRSFSCRSIRNVALEDISATDPIPTPMAEKATFGYIVPWTDSGQARLVIAALEAGFYGHTSDEAFVQKGRRFPAGSVIFAAQKNAPDFDQGLRQLAFDMGAELVGMADSWVDEGPNFGSRSFAALRSPRIAIAWGDGTRALSAGNTRFVFERQLGLPVTPIRTRALGRADLSLYDVLILPEMSGDASGLLGQSGVDEIRSFVAAGGLLLGLGNAVDLLSGDDLHLLATHRERAAPIENDAPPEAESDSLTGPVDGLLFNDAADYDAYVHNRSASPADIPGVLVRAEADPDHWLAAGYEDATALVAGEQIYRPLNEADGVNVFVFATAETLSQSGYLWDDSRLQLAMKPLVMAQATGEGVTIGFTQSPTIRAYLDGLNLLLANAVLLGPARLSN